MIRNLVVIIVFLSLIVSCKKDIKVEPDVDTGPSERYKILTSHYWRLTGKWNDTTDYAKAHPELVPLSTSIDNFFFTDSCRYYTSGYYSPDGFLYNVKGKWCGYPNTNPLFVKDYPWSLSNNDQTFNSYGTFSIITLNDTVFKFYHYQIYNFTGLLVTVYELKPFEYK